MEIAAFTISSFSGIPLCTRLFETLFPQLTRSNCISVVHCHQRDLVDYSEQIILKPLATFDSFSSFRTQSRSFKAKKYWLILYYMLSFLLFHRDPVVYVIDANSCVLALVIKKIFFFKKVKVIYHQFEMDIPESKTRLDSFFFGILRKMSRDLDLFVAPEINRLDYFRTVLQIDCAEYMLFPNTTATATTTARLPGAKIVFGHVGSLGPDHFVEEIVEVFGRIGSSVELWLIGRTATPVKKQIDRLGVSNVRLIDQVPHKELSSYYNLIDFGLILYRPVDLNTIFCAPNKLFEFWSHGIPVIAPRLKGLVPLFSEHFLGKLVDMEDHSILHDQIVETVAQSGAFDRVKITNYFKDHLSIGTYLEHFRVLLER